MVKPRDTKKGMGEDRGPGRVDGVLSRAEEVMEIQHAAAKYQTGSRPPKPAKPRPKAPPVRTPGRSVAEPALLHGLNIINLARWCTAASLVCFLAAAMAFFYPLNLGAFKLVSVGDEASGGGRKAALADLPDLAGNGKAGSAGGWGDDSPGTAGKGSGSSGGGVSVGALVGMEHNISFMIFSRPDKAEVIIDGMPRGSTPVGANVSCTAGEPVTLELRKPGRKVWERTIPCKSGNIKVKAKLEKR